MRCERYYSAFLHVVQPLSSSFCSEKNKVFCQTFVHKSLRGFGAQTCALGKKPQHFNNLIIKPIVGLRSHILRKDPFVGAGMRRSDAPSPNILLNLAGLLSPRPRFLSCRKERNQRFAKEEVSSLDSPPRGTSPRELRKAKFSPPDFPITRWLLGFASVTPRVVGTYVERTRYRYRGVSKGVMLDPFRWRSRNQEVPCAPFVHFLAIGNGPRVQGRGATLQIVFAESSEKETLFPSPARTIKGASLQKVRVRAWAE